MYCGIIILFVCGHVFYLWHVATNYYADSAALVFIIIMTF